MTPIYVWEFHYRDFLSVVKQQIVSSICSRVFSACITHHVSLVTDVHVTEFCNVQLILGVSCQVLRLVVIQISFSETLHTQIMR